VTLRALGAQMAQSSIKWHKALSNGTNLDPQKDATFIWPIIHNVVIVN